MAIDYTNYLEVDATVEGAFTFTNRAGTVHGSDGLKASNTAGEWCRGVTSTPSGGTGPTANPSGRSAFVYIETSSPSASSVWAMRRKTSFDTTSVTLALDLKYNLNANVASKFYVEYATVASPNETTDWTVHSTVQCNATNAWIDRTFIFFDVSSSTTHVRIRCDTDNSFLNDIAFSTWHEYEFDSAGPWVRGTDDSKAFGYSGKTVSLPALETGDLIFVSVGYHTGTGTIPTAMAISGYTELANDAINSTTRMAVLYRYVDGTEGYTGDGSDTVSLTWAGGAWLYTSHMSSAIIGGADPDDQAPSISSFATSSSTTTPNPPNLSPGSTEDFLWFVPLAVGAYSSQILLSYPTGYSGVSAPGSGTNLMSVHAYRVLNASSENPSTFLYNDVVFYGGYTVAIWPVTAVDYTETATDATGVTDSATATKTGSRTATDPATVTDTTTRSVGAARTATDPVGVADGVTVTKRSTRTATDSAGVTDTVERVTALVRTVTDTVGVTDSVERVTASRRTVTDSVGVADTVVTARVVVVVVSDPVGAADVVDGTVFSGEAPTVTDTVDVTDSVVRVTETVRTVTGPVTVTDQPVVVHAQTRVSVDPVAVTDTVEASRGIGAIATDGVGVSDTVTVVQQTAYTEPVTEPVTVTDAVDRVTETTRTVTEQVGITDGVTTARALVVVITDTVGATDIPQGAKTTQVTVTETVNATDDVIQAFGFGRTITEPVTGTDSVERVHLALRTITEAVDVSESVGSVSFGDYFWDRRPRTHTPNPATHTTDEPVWSPDGVTYTTDEPAYTSLTPDGPAWS